MTNKKLNWFQRQYHKVSRYFQRLFISSKLDQKNGNFDIEKLPSEMRDVISIVKKVLSHENTKVYHSKNNKAKNLEYVITDDIYEISLTNDGYEYEVLRFKHEDDVLSIMINTKVLVYIHWLIERRTELNFKRKKDEINLANDKQIHKFVDLLNK